MNTSNIYEAAFYLSSPGNFLDRIEVKPYGVYYHVSGNSLEAMKKRYNGRGTKVNYRPFISWIDKLNEIKEKELAKAVKL